MAQRLRDKRVLLTEARDFMGPAIAELFTEEGADVVADTSDLTDPARPAQLVAETGNVDVLVANLSIPNPRALAHETTDAQWAEVFDRLVHPLHRLVKAVLPQMIARKSGKIVVVGSASGDCQESCAWGRLTFTGP